MSRAHVARLARDATLRELRLGELLVRHGAIIDAFYCVAAGSLKLSLDQGQGGRVFGIISSGETFCEAAVLLRAPSPFDVVTLSDAIVAAVPLAQIEALMERDRIFSRSLIELLARRALAAMMDLEAGTRHAPQRLASYLTSLAQPAGKAGAWNARLPVSKTLVAARLGIKKETLSRLLRGFADDGVIAVAQRDIAILDRDRLLQLSLNHT